MFPPFSRTVAPFAVASLTCSSISVTCSLRTRGPISVFSSMGSPTLSALANSTNFDVNCSDTLCCTMNLLAAIQLCPEFMNLLVTATFAASSISASFSTMKGSLPPSSKTNFFMFFAAATATFCPAETLPVKVTARISSLLIRDDAARPSIRRV